MEADLAFPLIEPPQAAVAITKTWMKDVGPKDVGLLTVG
jgi:hypothetical protein